MPTYEGVSWAGTVNTIGRAAALASESGRAPTIRILPPQDCDFLSTTIALHQSRFLLGADTALTHYTADTSLREKRCSDNA
jgi:hypothetical protein